LLGAWTSRTGITIENGQLHALPRSLWDRAQLLFDWRNQRNHASDVNDWVQAAPGGEGAIIAFRSPLDDNRSVVAITGTSPEQVAKVAGVLQASESVPKIQDDVVLMRAGDIETFRMARRYDVGSLARWTWLRWNLSDQPIVIAILLFAACAAMAAVAFVILGVKARRRLQGANR
jgi:cellulose synthase (UDP-forming)